MKRLAGLLALPLLLGAASPETRELIESGNSFYRMGLYEEAGKQYLHAAEMERDSAEISYNLGNVYYQKYIESKGSAVPGTVNDRTGEWEQKAVGSYRQAVAAASATLRARALFNLGNTYAQGERREEAIGAYQEALRILPNDEDTKHNLELLLKGKKVPPLDIATRGTNTVKTIGLIPKAGAGPKLTNVISKAQAMGGGAGAGDALDSGGGQGAQEANASGGGGQGAQTDQAGGAGSGAGAAGEAGGKDDKSVKMDSGGKKTDEAESKAAAEASSGGKTAGKTTGAGGPAGAVEGKAGEAPPEKSNPKDQAGKAEAAAAKADPDPKDQDKTASAASDSLDPQKKEVLDKASKAEQRYIDHWTRPPDMKKPKDQEW
jgi:tetratricopeptide (TPR) repeat protein